MEDYKIVKDSKLDNIKDVSRKYSLVNEIVDTFWHIDAWLGGVTSAAVGSGFIWLDNVVYDNMVHRYD